MRGLPLYPANLAFIGLASCWGPRGFVKRMFTHSFADLLQGAGVDFARGFHRLACAAGSRSNAIPMVSRRSHEFSSLSRTRFSGRIGLNSWSPGYRRITTAILSGCPSSQARLSSRWRATMPGVQFRRRDWTTHATSRSRDTHGSST